MSRDLSKAKTPVPTYLVGQRLAVEHCATVGRVTEHLDQVQEAVNRARQGIAAGVPVDAAAIVKLAYSGARAAGALEALNAILEAERALREALDLVEGIQARTAPRKEP